MKDDLPIIPFASPGDWDAWLDDHHETSPGLWLKIGKAGSGLDSVTYAEAVEVALAHGWIDGQKGKFDETYWLQRFTPRGPRSKWSMINRDKALRLIERRAMKPAGLREVERAREDGRWEAAYQSPRGATVPDDLQAALDANDAAREFFATLSGANRYAILYRIQDAKKPETRARRIEKFIEMLTEQKTLHP